METEWDFDAPQYIDFNHFCDDKNVEDYFSKYKFITKWEFIFGY